MKTWVTTPRRRCQLDARFSFGAWLSAVASSWPACQVDPGTSTVVLSGGVFQNRRLLERTSALLGEAGLRVLTPELLPPNDGGIALGQLLVGNCG